MKLPRPGRRWRLKSWHGELRRHTLAPSQFGVEVARAAAGYRAGERVGGAGGSGRARDFVEGVDLAAAIDSGTAMRKVEELARFTKTARGGSS